jgi:putative endonuclease
VAEWLKALVSKTSMGLRSIEGSNPSPSAILHVMITVYVLEGTTGKRYVGITNNLERRLIEHRNHTTKGSQIIGTFTLLHVEQLSDYATARAREKFLKSGQGRVWLRRKYPQRGPPEAGKAAP